jgi:exopolysaccharide biosynthesis protein
MARSLALVLALGALLHAAPARASDVWTAPNPGVRHLQRTGAGPAEYHVLVVDLSVPGVAIRCTPPAERWQTTSAYGRRASLAAAINGGFWSPSGEGEGLGAGAGQLWSFDNDRLGFFAVGRDGRAWISRPSDLVRASRRGITDGVSGRPLLVDRGRLSDELAAFPHATERQPRTAVGVSADGRTVFLLTVDGRRGASRGSTLLEVAELLLELGAWRAINVDGGGSTTLYVASEGGLINRPSERTERVVLNHIGVQAPPPPEPSPRREP